MASLEHRTASSQGVQSKRAVRLPLSWAGLTVVLVNMALATLALWAWTACGSIGSGLGYVRRRSLDPRFLFQVLWQR